MRKMFIFAREGFCKIFNQMIFAVFIIFLLTVVNTALASEKNSGALGYGGKVRTRDPGVNMYEGNNITGNFDVRILPFDPHKRMSDEELMRNTLLSSRTLAGGSRGIDISEKSPAKEKGYPLGISHTPFVINKENMRQTVYSSKIMKNRWVKS